MELEEVEKILSNDNANLMDDLSLDSFLMVELIVEIETTFDIEFDMNDLNINKLKIYGNLKQFIKDNMLND